MSFFDEERPVKKTTHEIGADLSLLSVGELKERIELLKSEIARLEAESVRKASGRAAAEGLFRT